jgi:hypothetical protein
MIKRLFVLFLVLLPTIAALPVSAAQDLSSTLRGRILLQVESKGEAWYVDPLSGKRAYLGRPADAFAVMRGYGLGVSDADLAKIAGPGEKDKDLALAKRLAGRILLAVQAKGEAYYVNPVDFKKYYLGRPADAFALMRAKGLGISNANLNKIPYIAQPPVEKTETRPADTTLEELKNPEAENEETPPATSTNTAQETVATATEKTFSVENLAWRGSVKIASNRHTPQLHYSTNGDLWLFYSDNYDSLYARVRRNGEATFNQETLVATKARKAHPWFDVQGQLKKLAVSGAGQVSILETTDQGNSWKLIKSYANQDPLCSPIYPEAKLIGRDGDILVFGYESNSGVFGCYTVIKSAEAKAGVWGDTIKAIGDGDLVSAAANGSTITIAGSASVFRSTDGGQNFVEIKGGDTTQDRLGSQSAIILNGKTYLGRSYSYGPEGQANKHLGIVLGGEDLNTPQRVAIQSGSSYYKGFEISGNGNIIVAVWTVYGSAGRLKVSISSDYGKTWSAASDIARTPTGYDIPFPETGENIGFKAASFQDQTAIAYTAQKGTSNDIYLIEYK